MTVPNTSSIYGKVRRPRSPQGDGAYDANGMSTSTGQQGQGQLGEPARPYNPQQPTSHPQPQQGFQANTPPGPGNQGGPQTFSQMQSQGQARPMPPQGAGMAPQGAGAPPQGGMQGLPQGSVYRPTAQQNQGNAQLQTAVSQTLAAPTRYDLPQVQQVRDALTAQLQTQYAGQQKQINDQLASRGLLSSSIAGGYYGDLATNQANSLADMNAKLIQDAAATNAADRSSALASAQNLSNSQSAQGIAGYNANLAGQNQTQQFGIQQGGLTGMYGGQQTLAGQAQAQQNAVQVGGLTGQYMAPGSTGAGQSTLGAQQLSQSGQQFAQNLALQSQLGQGNLGVAQQQANTGAAAQQAQAQQAQQQLNAQTQQFGQTYMLQQAAQNLNAQVQTGQLSIAQAQQQLAQLQNSQQYGLAQGSQGIAQQQANTQQQQVAGQLQLGQAQLAQSGQQFQQNFAQNAAQFGQTYALQQAQQDLNRQVQTGQLTIAQAQQKLSELSNTQQFGLAQGSQGIAQQQANTATAAQQAQAQYQQGQLGVAEKQVALQDSQFQQNFTQNVSQFGQTYALQKAAQDLNTKVQNGQLDNQTAQQALAELTQRTQATQFTQSLDAQKAQTGIANTLGLAGLMNTPGGNLFGGSTDAQNKATFLDIYKKLGITPPTETPVVTPPVVTPGGGGTTGGTTGGTGGNGGTEGKGVGPGGQQIVPGVDTRVAPDLGQQAFAMANPDQQSLMSRQMAPEQMGLTPEQLAQLQRMLGIGDAQMASTDF